MDAFVTGIVWFVAFVFSVTVHEAGHAVAAKLGGDPTAYEGGQASLDPVPHIRREPFGMIVLPLISLVVAGWPLGFASAPYDPDWAERHPRRAAWMSLAGPAANLAVVLLCAAIIWLGIALGELGSPQTAVYTGVVEAYGDGVWQAASLLLSIFFSLNLILLVFNLIPLPPLDGASAIGLLLSDESARKVRDVAKDPAFGMIGLLVAWYAFRPIFGPIFTLSLNLLYPGAGYR